MPSSEVQGRSWADTTAAHSKVSTPGFRSLPRCVSTTQRISAGTRNGLRTQSKSPRFTKTKAGSVLDIEPWGTKPGRTGLLTSR